MCIRRAFDGWPVRGDLPCSSAPSNPARASVKPRLSFLPQLIGGGVECTEMISSPATTCNVPQNYGTGESASTSVQDSLPEAGGTPSPDFFALSLISILPSGGALTLLAPYLQQLHLQLRTFMCEKSRANNHAASGPYKAPTCVRATPPLFPTMVKTTWICM
jgi:hypothetical protein